ncbi:MAG: hypothetical protein Q4D96_12590 [Propionibacteriaceae bacterium]|nr:hypothetical protein [Propionibacteriaceae bacterium]
MTGFADFRNLPTIMDLAQEVEVMTALMNMPVDHLTEHVTEFCALIDDLILSHHDSGYFEIRPENEGELLAFADWLEVILPQLGVPVGHTADAFRITHEDLQETYPQLRARDAEDNPDGPNAIRRDAEAAKELQAFWYMPRKMSASVELAVIRALRAIPVERLTAHRDQFVEIVERLDGSHGSSTGGMYGLTPHNEAEFHDFAAWLRRLAPSMGWEPERSWTFDMKFDQLARKNRALRQAAALGPQPGTPVVLQLAERVKESDELKILGAGAAGQDINLVGRGWGFVAYRGWRVLNPDGTLAYAWSTPGVEELVTDLVGLSVAEVAPQSRVTMADPALLLSDGRWLEVFSRDPLAPWTMRIGGGIFTGAPTAPEWV